MRSHFPVLIVLGAATLGLLSFAGAANPSRDAQVATFARECAEHVRARRWAPMLACFDTSEIDELHRSYLRRFAPAYAPIPNELKVGFGPGIDKAALIDMTPSELFAGAIEGAIAAQASNAQAVVHQLDARVRGVEHQIENVYRIKVRARARVRVSGEGRRYDHEMLLTARVHGDDVRLAVPKALAELLDPQ